jgi:APA family basic amino acid/polyamine antiporter
VIVCAGVWAIRRTNPELPRPFKTPMVPFVPIMGILIALLMMLGLPGDTWIRLIVWLIIGMFIYLTYGRYHSRVQLMASGADEPKTPKVMAD